MHNFRWIRKPFDKDTAAALSDALVGSRLD